MKRSSVLFIQTAFIGDVILMTAQLETWHKAFPQDDIDILVKKGNEKLFEGHPFVRKVLVMDKSAGKWRELRRLVKEVRMARYDKVFNLHRFFSSGWIVARSGAPVCVGFDKNPLAAFYTSRISHSVEGGQHEIERNHEIIMAFAKCDTSMPRLYPTPDDLMSAKAKGDYYVIAPASVWFTKQYPVEGWLQLIASLDAAVPIYLIGAPGDRELCDEIIHRAGDRTLVNVAGEMTLLQSAALIACARMSYVNDSAPMHLATAMNAPVTAIYCSTVPSFGFGPRSNQSIIKETYHDLDCRPCGLHGHKACPKGHFKCSEMRW